MSAWTILARVLRPQGNRGEVLADIFTDFPEQFESRKRLFLLPEGVIEDEARSAVEAREVNLESFWHPHGRNAGRVVFKFGDSNSIEDAEALAKLLVVIPASERAPLEPGAVFLDQIVGCKVLDRGNEIGAVEEVGFSAGAPLLVVRAPDGEELLVPFAEEFIEKFAPEERRLEMRLPEGLLDINRREHGEQKS